MSRPDSYVLKLNALKGDLRVQIEHCSRTLLALIRIKADENYAESATDLEKSNVEALTQIIQSGLSVLEQISWEE